MDQASRSLCPLDQLTVDIVTDDVSDNYVSKTLFAVSEFANIIRAGAKALSGEALLCANLGFGCRLTSTAAGVRHVMLFDTGPEGAIFLRNCANLGIELGEIECIAVSHGHWDHMAALPATLEAIGEEGGKTTVHVNPGMFNERAVRLASGTIVPAAKSAVARRNVGPRVQMSSTTRRHACCSTIISTIAAKSHGGALLKRVAPII